MLKINTENTLGDVNYFSISGKDGDREYYRLGHFDSKEAARVQIAILIGNKVERRKGKNAHDMQDI